MTETVKNHLHNRSRYTTNVQIEVTVNGGFGLSINARRSEESELYIPLARPTCARYGCVSMERRVGGDLNVVSYRDVRRSSGFHCARTHLLVVETSTSSSVGEQRCLSHRSLQRLIFFFLLRIFTTIILAIDNEWVGTSVARLRHDAPSLVIVAKKNCTSFWLPAHQRSLERSPRVFFEQRPRFDDRCFHFRDRQCSLHGSYLREIEQFL